MAKDILHANHSGLEAAIVGEELRLTVTVEPEAGQDGIGVPAGTIADVGKVPVFTGPGSGDYQLQLQAAAIIESVRGGAGFVPASGAITLNLEDARVFLIDVTANITSWAFENAPDWNAFSPIVRVVWRQDATGGRAITGGPSLTFRDRRSPADFNTAPNGITEQHIWHDGTGLVTAIVENGRLDLEPHVLSFATNGAQLVAITHPVTMNLGDVTNRQANGNVGTGTLTYQRGRAGALTTVSGVTAFQANDVLVVTLADSTNASAISIPRWLA